MHLSRFLLRRLAYLLVQLWGVATIAFFLVHLIPGNPAQALAGSGASAESIHGIEKQLGFAFMDDDVTVADVSSFADLVGMVQKRRPDTLST